MAYIGKSPTIGNFQKCDSISVVNGQASYTMQVNSVNVSPESENHMLVSLNGILQAPVDSFTISGSTITFASNLATGDVIDFIMLLGNVLDLGTPSDNTVATASLKANAVTAAKLNNDIISGQTALTAEPADTDEFLVSDAGTIKRIDYSLIKGGGITEADMYRWTTTISNVSPNPLTGNWERVDDSSFSKMGTGITETSGIFSFPSTGLYHVGFVAFGTSNGSGGNLTMYATTDNSSYDSIAHTNFGAYGGWYWNTYIQALVNVTDTSNVKVKFGANIGSTTKDMYGNTNSTYTGASFIRLGDSQ